MFTGIISAVGEVTSVTELAGGRSLTVSSPGFFAECEIGDSVANSGVCLTVTSNADDQAEFFAQIETIDKTTLGNWKVGDPVNLELPVRLSDRLGGHLVQGHVDDVTTIIAMKGLSDGSIHATINIPKELSRFIVDRGSICLNGVSLTVASRDEDTFMVALIPTTVEKTSFAYAEPGDFINVEIDSIARYVEQLISNRK